MHMPNTKVKFVIGGVLIVFPLQSLLINEDAFNLFSPISQDQCLLLEANMIHLSLSFLLYSEVAKAKHTLTHLMN